VNTVAFTLDALTTAGEFIDPVSTELRLQFALDKRGETRD
jgi:hypothetical protein